MCDNSIAFLGSSGKVCAVPGQGRLPECACSRDRGREPAEPERACMMWYRAVAHVSLYFSCPPSLAPRRLPVAVAAHPSLRPSARPSEVLSPFWRHHASFALPPTSVRPCACARPSVRGTTDRSTEMEVVAARGGADVGHVLRPPSCCVASSSSFRLLSCAPLPALRDCARGTAPIASKHVWNDYLNDSKLARALKKIGLGMAPLRGPQNSPEVLALAFRNQFLSGQVLHGMFPLLCRILCLWVTVRTSPDSMVGIIQ